MPSAFDRARSTTSDVGCVIINVWMADGLSPASKERSLSGADVQE